MDYDKIVKTLVLSSVDSILFHPLDTTKLRLINPVQLKTTFITSTPKLTKRSVVFDNLSDALKNPYISGFTTGLIEGMCLYTIYRKRFMVTESIISNSIFFGLYNDYKREGDLKQNTILSLSLGAFSTIVPNIRLDRRAITIKALRSMLSRTFMTNTLSNI